MEIVTFQFSLFTSQLRIMSTNLSNVRHTRGFDLVKPLSIFSMIVIMLPLVLLPLASIFIFGNEQRAWTISGML